MQIAIAHLNFPISDALREFVHRRIARAMQSFEGDIAHVDVRLRDVNGPRGGIDTECRVVLKIAGRVRPVVVKGGGTDGYEAVQRACTRLREAISRVRTRQQRLDRLGVSPEKTASARMAPSPAPEAAQESRKASGVEGRIVVTAADREHLHELIRASRDTPDRDAARALADELEYAEIVPAERIARNVMTMNSHAVFRDEETGEEREIILVYPKSSDPEHGRISVLAPLGAALLGLSEGQTIDWPLPGGRRRRYRVVTVLYQPEAAGDRNL